MDQSLLVRSGHRLVDELDKTKFKPRAVLWFHDVELDNWLLWLVPTLAKPDKQEFYRIVSKILSQADLDREIAPSAIRLIAGNHPAIKALARMFRVDGRSDVHINNNMLNGFYVPDGIILRMLDETARSTAA